MDVFITNIPVQVSDKQLNTFFQKTLKVFNIHTFSCAKLRGKGCAILTILDVNGANMFLTTHGEGENNRKPSGMTTRLVIMDRPIYCRPSKSLPDELLLKTLHTEEKAWTTKSKSSVGHQAAEEELLRTFRFSTMRVGSLGYRGPDLAFIPQNTDLRGGFVRFGKKGFAVFMKGEGALRFEHKLEIPYYTVNQALLGGLKTPTIVLSLSKAPKIYRFLGDRLSEVLNTIFAAALFDKHAPRRARVCSLSPDHEQIVGTCMAYELTLVNNTDITHVQKLLHIDRGLPRAISWPLRTITPQIDFGSDLRRLLDALTDVNRFGSMPFALMFQVQRLATNFFLTPGTVLELLPKVMDLARQYSTQAAASAIGLLSQSLPFPGPETVAEQFSPFRLSKRLEAFAETFRYAGSMYDLAERHAHIILIHKLHVTPAGNYLQGPECEVKNRVLRKYPSHTDHFIRVRFSDENGDPVQFEPSTQADDVYHRRFKGVLDGMTSIAGRGYTFLGFSHSSLRSQTCWFMAPFVYNQELHHAKDVIANLGDFDHIRSPAKCAARIGQAFSETNAAIRIRPENFIRQQDIERNGRCFTDGVGTASLQLFQKIWREYALSRNPKPTALQIRFAGAKGMIALDTRLQAELLCVRDSMMKFEAENAWDIEICGAAFKPLPCYLNRQFVKIFEDLGVPPDVFLELQKDAVERLRQVTLTPVKAADFLQSSYVAQAARLPTLIRLLNDIGVNFQADDFLRDIVEIAALVQLRDIKHRARILLNQGVTLYGVVDETGILQEGEIYCVTEDYKGGRHVLTGGQVVITRAPALHPGDIQIVKAVDVPGDSPLTALRNCVVFSSNGARDLPSMLSGGDLDGDLYNVIFDPRLMPRCTYTPADYPRPMPVDIGTKVERHHMTAFFLQFMETDQLGRICSLHMQLADQKGGGTADPDCIRLAELASTAVDFSKTGIPVDMTKCPRYNRFRPDFMAPGPRVVIEKEIKLIDDESPSGEDTDPLYSDLEPEFKPYRYYESHKVLGILYRAIDERRFFEELQKEARAHVKSEVSLMERLWMYVRRETLLVQFEHHRSWASDTKDAYENFIVNTAYQYTLQPHQPLSELEVFSGTIIGNSGGTQNKRVRELNRKMKEQVDRDIAFFVGCILYGDYEKGNRDEAFERSIACLAVAMEEPGRMAEGMGVLESFRYVAAAVCLNELEKFQGDFVALRPL